MAMIANELVSQSPRIVWRGVKRILRPVKHALFKPSERAANPYGTHIPVLIGLSRMVEVRRVLEFGCGEYSTLTFLNRAAFPHLAELKSLETDINWLNILAKQTDGDWRVKLEHVEGQMHSAANGIELDDYELAFIDDSTTPEERAITIYEIAAKQAASTIVVIHDFEVPLYRQAAKSFAHNFKFNTFNPHTGVVWNDAAISKSKLRQLRSLIKRHSKHLEPDDIGGWLQVLNTFK
jgi:hypothetical protein